MRRVALAPLTAAVLLCGAAPARADWPSLAGSTTIEGDKTGYALVKLDRPVSLWSEDEDEEAFVSVDLRGSGRFYGLILREDRPGAKPFTAFQLHSDRYEYEPSDWLWTSSELDEDAEGVETIPAGVYRLYLVADGKPVRATLRLPGRSGRTTVTPQVPVPQTISDIPRVDGGIAPNVSVMGATNTLRSTGFVGLQYRYDQQNTAYEQAEVCSYGPDADTPPPTAYGPGCGDPAGRAADEASWRVEELQWMAEGEVEWLADDPPGWLLSWPEYYQRWAEWTAEDLQDGYLPYPPYPVPYTGVHSPQSWTDAWDFPVAIDAKPGPWSLGGNAQFAGAPSKFELTGLWLDYEPKPGTPLPQRPADVPAPAPPPASAPAADPKAATPAPASAPAPAGLDAKPGAKKTSPKEKKRCVAKKRGKRRACAKRGAKAKRRAGKPSRRRK